MLSAVRRNATLRSRLLRIALVVALSIAVWTFAEARSLTLATRTVTLVLTAPAGSTLTAWSEPDTTRRVTVSLQLQGSRAALDRAEQRLSEPVELVIGDGLPASVGRESVSLRDALRDHSAFDRLAVSLVDVTPQSIEVRIDEMVEKTVNVNVVASGADFDSPPIAEPAAITVTGPASILNATVVESLDATVSSSQRALLRDGSTTEVPSIPVSIPDAWQSELVRVSPTSVKATIALRSTIESHEVPSVPVMVRLSPTQMQQWRVRVAPEDGYLRDVIVSGPAQAIEAIIAGRQRVVATLQLESVELTAGPAVFEAVLSGQARGLDFVVADTSVPVEVTAIEPEAAADPG